MKLKELRHQVIVLEPSLRCLALKVGFNESIENSNSLLKERRMILGKIRLGREFQVRALGLFIERKEFAISTLNRPRMPTSNNFNVVDNHFLRA